jgi:magnesium-transporting ATPase (P-type)
MYVLIISSIVSGAFQVRRVSRPPRATSSGSWPLRASALARCPTHAPAPHLQDWKEFALILLVVIVNVVIGVLQEGKAEKATDAIKSMLSPSATVVRKGERCTVEAKLLVPGDVIFIISGDRLPADVRWVLVNNLQVMEAILTGESLPAVKDLRPAAPDAGLGDQTCMGFSGTLAVYGQALGVVVATGDRAEIGKINTLVSNVANVKTPLLEQLEEFGTYLSIFAIILAVITFVVSFVVRGQSGVNAFRDAMTVAVAIIPEGLPSVVTITLALGVQHMAVNKAIIRQLPAVETLGAVSVICSDKTGTLTKNEMTATSVHTSVGPSRVTGSGYIPEGLIHGDDGQPLVAGSAAGLRMQQLLLCGGLCNDANLAPIASAPTVAKAVANPLQAGNVVKRKAEALEWKLTGDPTDGALLTVAMKAGHRALKLLTSQYPRIDTIPFESDYKFMGSLHSMSPSVGAPAQRVMLVKGAPDRLIPRCVTQAAGGDPWASEPINLEYWLAANKAYALQGLRVLALCQAVMPQGCTKVEPSDVLEGAPRLQLNCLVAIVDPPRQEAIDAVVECKRAGIITKMITGDHPDTAETIGKWIGIETAEVLTGHQMEEMDDEELETHVEDCNIFARATPEHKLRIVRALQKHGHIVAMTGDGVNDAPALKQASVGVAMGITGTDVAKEASKMILADDNFATIVKAVKEGRAVYDNLRKIQMFVLPTSFAQSLGIAFSIFAGGDRPLSPVKVLYVNMVTAVTLGLVLALEKPEPSVMDRPPRRPEKPIVGKYMAWRTFFATVLVIVGMLGNLEITLSQYDPDGTNTAAALTRAQTVAMNVLVFSQCFYIINCRYLTETSLRYDVLTANPWLSVLALSNALLQLLITYTPGITFFFDTTGLDGYEWARIVGTAASIFLLVEAEKAVGPQYLKPYILPLVRAAFEFVPWAMGRKKSKLAVRYRKAAAAAAAAGDDEDEDEESAELDWGASKGGSKRKAAGKGLQRRSSQYPLAAPSGTAPPQKFLVPTSPTSSSPTSPAMSPRAAANVPLLETPVVVVQNAAAVAASASRSARIGAMALAPPAEPESAAAAFVKTLPLPVFRLLKSKGAIDGKGTVLMPVVLTEEEEDAIGDPGTLMRLADLGILSV